MVCVFSLAALVLGAMPAGAFYLEMPKALKEIGAKQKVLGTKLTQESGETPAPSVEPVEPAPPADGGNTGNPPAPLQPVEPANPPSQPGATCRIDGVEQPGACENNNQGGQSGQNNNQSNPQDEARRKTQDAQQLKDIKRNVKRMEVDLKRFKSMYGKAKGMEMTAEIKANLDKADAIIKELNNAQTVDEIQNIDMGALGDIINELEGSRQDIEENVNRVQDVKRGIKGMMNGIKMYESLIKKLVKQKITIPEEITANLKKAKEIYAAVNKAKNWDEMEAAGVEDLQDIMVSLEENRDSLEKLARWNETVKQSDKELKSIASELKKAKSSLASLAKKGFDMKAEYAEAEEAYNKLKAASAEAKKKIAAGEADDAFDLMENDVFGQMEEVWGKVKIISMMSNLGRFASDFKKRIAAGQKTIRDLKRKKLATKEAEVKLNEINIKGNEIVAMIKTKKIDDDILSAKFDELDSLGQEFEEIVSELTGETEEMPWDAGKDQLKSMDVDWSVLPKKQPIIDDTNG